MSNFYPCNRGQKFSFRGMVRPTESVRLLRPAEGRETGLPAGR